MSFRRSYAVWEITLACNLACGHCGSRAGKARQHELSTSEALDLIRQLAEVGIDEVTLIGGEAFLRKDWLTLVRAIREHGMTCGLTTGGYGISARHVQGMLDAGLQQVSISIDGLEETHDKLRGRAGSWRACFASMLAVSQADIPVTCNTQINRLTAPELSEAYALQRDAGMEAWQVQLTVPMGNAADNWQILLQPVELLDLFPLLARLKGQADDDGVDFFCGNNVGYYGPHDAVLRRIAGNHNVWDGCQAGFTTLGIEADGTIKGCPSLPSRAYGGGNIRHQSLEEIVTQAPELNFNLGGTTEHLWGFCRSCEYAKLCRGGCSWTAHVFFDRPGNNPYCHHRALDFAKRGLRERFVLQRAAEGVPFDNGVFTLTEEPLDAPWPAGDRARFAPDARSAC
jgi:radical SAM protein with 4Fe4S-binding SPASM domain